MLRAIWFLFLLSSVIFFGSKFFFLDGSKVDLIIAFICITLIEIDDIKEKLK